MAVMPEFIDIDQTPTDCGQVFRSLLREFPHLSDIARIVLPVINRRFTDEREVAECSVVEDAPEPFFPDRPHADMLVPVKPAPSLTFRIVQVDYSKKR